MSPAPKVPVAKPTAAEIEDKAKTTKNGAAARREAGGESPSVEWRGKTYKMRPKVPFRLLKFFGRGDQMGPVEMLGIAEAVFIDNSFEQFWVETEDLDMEDGAIAFGELLELAFKEYGLSLGESEALPKS